MTKKKRRWPLLYLSDCHVLHYATVAIVENMTNKTRHLSSSWGTTDTSADERALPSNCCHWLTTPTNAAGDADKGNVNDVEEAMEQIDGVG